jgi:hypothetical protein
VAILQYGEIVEPDISAKPEKLLCLMLTFQCTAECSHCGTMSSPREDTWLPIEHALSAIDEAARLDYTGVVLTGGESTLAAEGLLQAITRAASLALPVRLVTNAHWATDDDTTESLLFDWVCAGLCELNISTGDRHARFVPLANAIRAAERAARLGLPVVVLVESGGPGEITATVVREGLRDQSVTIAERVWSRLTPFPGTSPAGAVDQSNLSRSTGCDGLFANITVQANGILSPCCGLGIRFVPELQMGQVGSDSLAAVERLARQDPLKQRIHQEGPERILAWAAARDPRILWEGMYAHRCHACIRLYKDPLVRQVLAAELHRQDQRGVST